MADIVVTVPKELWHPWVDEGNLPGEPWSGLVSHFWLASRTFPGHVKRGDRLYIVAYGKLRGYAPVVGVEYRCRLRPEVGCILRHGDAVAVTIAEPIPGFRGWRYVWWNQAREQPFPNWMIA